MFLIMYFMPWQSTKVRSSNQFPEVSLKSIQIQSLWSESEFEFKFYWDWDKVSITKVVSNSLDIFLGLESILGLTGQHATVVILRLSKIRWTIQKPCISQVNIRCIVPKLMMRRFTKHQIHTYYTYCFLNNSYNINQKI
jgi:hypothetical protein